MKKTEWLIECIKKYREGYIGDAWDIFWEFRNKKDIFALENSKESSIQLFCYLCCFGMARSKTRLAYSNINKFHKFYINSLDSFKELNKFNFESFDKVNKDDFLKYYSNIQNNLKKIDVSCTNTMVTKILMAITGQTPAFDTYFVDEFRKNVGRFSGNIYDALLKLHNKYKNEWQIELINLPKEYKIIIDEYKKPIKIPIARLIDMGFWYYHDEKNDR